MMYEYDFIDKGNGTYWVMRAGEHLATIERHCFYGITLCVMPDYQDVVSYEDDMMMEREFAARYM